MALLTYALVSLAEVKTALGIELSDTSQDAALEIVINAATEQIEGFTQNVFVQRALNEYVTGAVNGRRGQARRIFLRYYPIVSVASIVDDSGEAILADDFVIWPKEGYLEHASNWPRPMAAVSGLGRWLVSYTAGRFASTALVAADLKQAAIALLRYWRARKVPGVGTKRVGDFYVTFNTGGGGDGGAGVDGGSPSLPDDVVVMLQRYISRSGG